MEEKVSPEVVEFTSIAVDLLMRQAPKDMSHIYSCYSTGDGVCFDFGSGQYRLDIDSEDDTVFYVARVMMFGENRIEVDEIFEELEEDEGFEDPQELVDAILNKAELAYLEFDMEDEDA